MNDDQYMDLAHPYASTEEREINVRIDEIIDRMCLVAGIPRSWLP